MLMGRHVKLTPIHHQGGRERNPFFRGTVREEDASGILITGRWIAMTMSNSVMIESEISADETHFFPWTNVETAQVIDEAVAKPGEEELTPEETFKRYYEEGKRLYLSESYFEAIPMLEAALRYQPENKRAIFYLEDARQKAEG